jgi:hypothetical protein
METYIKIPTSDWFEINWILNSKKESSTLLVFVHGFTGNMWEAHFYCAKEYFTKKWYDVYRFNLYTSWGKTRKLKDCSVRDHSLDIWIVADYFSQYKEIIFIGHSLAWPCLSGVTGFVSNVKKIILWDPAYDMKITEESFYNEWKKVKYSASGKHIEISHEMRREFLEDNFLEQLQRHSFPKNDIYAIYADGARHINYKAATDKMWVESYVIHWANHGFTQEWKYKELFEKTLEYIQK